MNVPEAQHCMSCGAELGLEPINVELALCSACPRCKNRQLDAFANQDGTIFDCGRCGGQFVAVEVLHAMIRRHESIELDTPHRLRAGNPINNPVTYIPCPFCRDLMLRHNFGKVSGIIVDVCAKHGTWFDVGELAHVLAFVGSGGLKRTAEVETEEHHRVSAAALSQPSPHTWESVNLEAHPSPITWAEMAESVQAFVDWVRGHFRRP
jgi:Zn-finger nucleic acid-binding protein